MFRPHQSQQISLTPRMNIDLDARNEPAKLPPCEEIESSRLGVAVLEAHQQSLADDTCSEMYVIHMYSNPSNRGVNGVCACCFLKVGLCLCCHHTRFQLKQRKVKTGTGSAHHTPTVQLNSKGKQVFPAPKNEKEN